MACTRKKMYGHLMKDEKVANKKLEKRPSKSKTCNTRRSDLFLVQIVNINTFKSNQTNRFFSIYHATTCKSR